MHVLLLPLFLLPALTLYMGTVGLVIGEKHLATKEVERSRGKQHREWSILFYTLGGWVENPRGATQDAVCFLAG